MEWSKRKHGAKSSVLLSALVGSQSRVLSDLEPRQADSRHQGPGLFQPIYVSPRGDNPNFDPVGIQSLTENEIPKLGKCLYLAGSALIVIRITTS